MPLNAIFVALWVYVGVQLATASTINLGYLNQAVALQVVGDEFKYTSHMGTMVLVYKNLQNWAMVGVSM